jgi:hypothetical protein
MNGAWLAVAVASLVLVGLAAGAAWAGQEIYTLDNAPPTPKLEQLALQESVSQYGITWTFEKPVRVGQFVNGDYYVVGPVTVVAIDPKPLFGTKVPQDQLDDVERTGVAEADRVRNGSMLNPPARQEVAYDSGIRNWFMPALAARLPIRMKPGDSLVSTISLKQGEKASFVYHSGGGRQSGDNCPTKVGAVLTCVAAPQPPDAFRPAYCDREQRIYLARDLRRNLLSSLERVKDAPDPAEFAEVFQKPWLNTGFFGFDEPMENMPHYGQWVGQAVSDAGLLLCMDFKPEEKEKLLENFVQVGIDYWGAVRGGHPGWQGWGGHGSGRKLPIVFAGIVLGDETMASPTKAFPKVEFGEDNQTMYGDCWTGAKVVFAGHSGVSTSTGEAPRPQWGPYEHMPPSQWDKEGMRNMQSEAYRRANTSCCWVGEALVLRTLKAEPQWNHDAFFDYVDRWMTEDDKEFRQEINEYFPDRNLVDETKTWYHQGYAGEDWVKEAWNKHRTAPGMPSTDGWKLTKVKGTVAGRAG